MIVLGGLLFRLIHPRVSGSTAFLSSTVTLCCLPVLETVPSWPLLNHPLFLIGSSSAPASRPTSLMNPKVVHACFFLNKRKYCDEWLNWMSVHFRTPCAEARAVHRGVQSLHQLQTHEYGRPWHVSFVQSLSFSLSHYIYFFPEPLAGNLRAMEKLFVISCHITTEPIACLLPSTLLRLYRVLEYKLCFTSRYFIFSCRREYISAVGANCSNWLCGGVRQDIEFLIV